MIVKWGGFVLHVRICLLLHDQAWISATYIGSSEEDHNH